MTRRKNTRTRWLWLFLGTVFLIPIASLLPSILLSNDVVDDSGVPSSTFESTHEESENTENIQTRKTSSIILNPQAQDLFVKEQQQYQRQTQVLQTWATAAVIVITLMVVYFYVKFPRVKTELQRQYPEAFAIVRKFSPLLALYLILAATVAYSIIHLFEHLWYLFQGIVSWCRGGSTESSLTPKRLSRRKERIRRNLHSYRETYRDQPARLSWWQLLLPSGLEDLDAHPNNAEGTISGIPIECPICLTKFVNGEGVIVASHCDCTNTIFHEDCILTWLSQKSRNPNQQCPCCRSTFFPVTGGVGRSQ